MRARPLVLIAGPQAPPAGGIASVIDRIFASALGERFELQRFATTPTRAPACGPLARGFDAAVARSLGFDGFVNRESRAKLRAFTSALAPAPDLVHLHCWHGYDFWLSACMAREAHRRAIPSILHLHGNFDVLHPQWSPLRKLGFRRALGVADRLVVLSEGWRRWFAAHRGDGCIDVVRNGVDVSRFRPRERIEPRDTLRLLFVGTRHATLKGAYDVLAVIPDVLHDAPRLRFVFVGEDTERIEERCVRGTPLAPACEFAGWKSPDEIPAYYADADVLLLPSQMEASPMALLEAMASGLPVVASAVGAIPEILEPPENGLLFEAGNRAALAAAIGALVRDADLRQRIGRNNRAKAEAELSVEHFAASLGHVYDDALARAA